MQKIGTNPNTGNSVVFSGGEGEWEEACQYDDQMQAEYEYEQAELAQGRDPWTGEQIKTVKTEKGWMAA